jgi:hypothetical protein
MQDIDTDLQFEIAEREIEEAERFASEYRLIIDIRRKAGFDTMHEESILEQFIDTLERAYAHCGSPMRQQDYQRPYNHRTLH